MSSIISLIGILLGLIVLVCLAYKGHSIIWVAPVCAIIVALLGGINLLGAYLGDYMQGVADYVMKWFPIFFLGAIYGKIMDVTGSAHSLANKLVKRIGSRFALLAVVLPCMLMTYGGISLFVVVFVIYPMGYAIYREADLPRTLLPGAIAFGAFGVTMATIPGTPQIQNMIPTEYYHTTPTAAPLLGIVAAVLIVIPGYLYLDWRVRCARKKGLHFVEDTKHQQAEFDETKHPKWHWLSGLVPLFVVVLLLNVLPLFLKNYGIATLTSNEAIVIALLGGIATACMMNVYQLKNIPTAINEGASGSLPAIMNTACAVGVGSIIKAVPGFTLLKRAMLNMPGSILFSEAVAVNVFAGATGSASGGLSVALDALAPHYLEKALEIGMNPEYLHRIAAIASGGLHALPHNGAILTLLAVSHCTHKESYLDICVTSGIVMVVSLLLSLVWGLFI